MVVAHIDPTIALTGATLPATPLADLRFLLVQRATTGAWHNLMSELQEAPGIAGGKAEWWVRREAERLTDGELDALNGDFDALWHDPTKISESWRVDFADANEAIARAKYPRLQQLADTIRATRYFAGRSDPPDDLNPKLGWVIPKGQLQTAASAQRQPHLRDQVVDASVRAAAIREVTEETGGSVSAAHFDLLDDVAPLHFANYPPRKVEVFLAALHSDAACHPSRQLSWLLAANPETRRCQWMSVRELLDYFAQPGVFDNTYTSILVHQLIARMGWETQLEGYAPPQARHTHTKAGAGLGRGAAAAAAKKPLLTAAPAEQASTAHTAEAEAASSAEAASAAARIAAQPCLRDLCLDRIDSAACEFEQRR